MNQSLLSRIDSLDADIAKIVGSTIAAPGAREALMRYYAKRGSIQVDIGIAEAGLADLLRAYAQADGLNTRVDGHSFDQLHAGFARATPAESLPYWLWARLGEGFRRYALDVLLTRSNKERELYAAIHQSIVCFKKADASLEARAYGGSEPTPAIRAWITAHRAAARTTLFWMSVSASEPSERLFRTAEEEFGHAIEQQQGDAAHPEYVWAKQFRAFLHALRGAKGDFAVAHAELKSIDTASEATQSSLNRSLAMLSSYDAVPPPAPPGGPPEGAPSAEQLARREAAARAALESAMAAVTQDPEDFMASYFGAVATWILGSISADKAVRARFANRTAAAIEGARARSTSAMSQAYATLVGLELMTAMMQTREHAPAAAKKAADILQRFEDFQPDWETRAIFMRDPVWQTVKNDAQYGHVHEALVDLPNFDALRRKFKVWPGKIDPEDET